MCSAEEIRFKLHERLLALDASNVQLMKLVVLDMVGGGEWKQAVAEHRFNVADLESALSLQAANHLGVPDSQPLRSASGDGHER